MNIRPSFKYRLMELLRASVFFLGFFILAMSFITITVSGNTSHSGYEISACIYIFVMGIIVIREDLRLGIQNGVGRLSVFFAVIFSSALASLALSVVGDLAITAAQALTKNMDNVTISSLYQIISSPQAVGAGEPAQLYASAGEHLAGILLTFALMMFANLSGSFISLVFYRLNKTWTIIVAAGTPVFLIWILPLVLSWFGIDLAAMFSKILITPASITVFFAVCAVLVAAFNFLLIRRTPIKAPAK